MQLFGKLQKWIQYHPIDGCGFGKRLMGQTWDSDGDKEAEVEAEVDPEVKVEAESEGEGLMFSGDGICNGEASERGNKMRMALALHTPKPWESQMRQQIRYDPFSSLQHYWVCYQPHSNWRRSCTLQWVQHPILLWVCQCWNKAWFQYVIIWVAVDLWYF